jgi:uncharacterized protein YegP (UPF0339 family)
MAMKDPRFKIYQDRSKQWRWKLQQRNSKIIADSAESYTRFDDVVRAVRRVIATAKAADIVL